MFEFPVSISRDRWWGSTLLSKWHSDVLLSASDWPPFYQPSTLADASWYVNVILEHCWNFNSAVHPPSIHRHWRNGVFAIISSHHPVPVALPVAFYHSADVFVAVTASTSWSSSSPVRDCLVRGGYASKLQLRTTALIIGHPVTIGTSNWGKTKSSYYQPDAVIIPQGHQRGVFSRDAGCNIFRASQQHPDESRIITSCRSVLQLMILKTYNQSQMRLSHGRCRRYLYSVWHSLSTSQVGGTVFLLFQINSFIFS